MSRYPIHTIDSAPEQSKPALRQLQQTFGMIPNIAGAMAESPTLISGFVPLFQHVHSSHLTEAEIQTCLLTNAVTNACTWAVAFHTALALKAGITEADVQAIRERRLPADAKLAALSTLARALIEKRGHVETQGFSNEMVLEVIAVSAASTITNYVGSIMQPPLEKQFQRYAWTDAA
jgi:AhpD family alkylhydroperoxidase